VAKRAAAREERLVTRARVEGEAAFQEAQMAARAAEWSSGLGPMATGEALGQPPGGEVGRQIDELG
jgi:hypothetical protein